MNEMHAMERQNEMESAQAQPGSTILDRIVFDKHRDLPRLQQDYSTERSGRQSQPRNKMGRDAVLGTLQQRRIIAEIKRASPSMGAIDMEVDCVQQALDYQAADAAMISVLTDERHFAGSFHLLEEIGRAVSCPLLCKDFIIDKWQIDAAAAAGADAILLIVSCFGQDRPGGSLDDLQHLYSHAWDKGLLPLVEIYAPDERYDAYQLRPCLLGVNSRNLQNMQIDLEQGAETLALLRRELSMPYARTARAQMGLPELPLFVGESGVFEPGDAQVWSQGGADCLLIGSSLMQVGKEQSRAELLRHRIAEFRNTLETS